MQTGTLLGTSLGNLLAGVASPQARDAGALNGMRMKEIQSQIGLQDAQAEAKRAETEMSSDDSLVKALAVAGGFNSPMGRADFRRAGAGELHAPAGPPTQEQFDGGASAIPIPAYVSAFPEAQAKFGALKQMLALGDKNIGNLSKSIQGDQRNAITKDLNVNNAADIGLQVAGLEGNVDPLQMRKADDLRKLGIDPRNIDLLSTVLSGNGKARYDSTGNVGTMDVLTGKQILNGIGNSTVNVNNAKVGEIGASTNQKNTAANLNNANIGLVGARTVNEKNKAAPGAGKTPLSPTAQKEVFEADDFVRNTQNVLGLLDQAKALNNQAYDGIGAATRAKIASNILPDDSPDGKKANATVNLDNIMTGQALESLKSTFGGNPTEGERAILLDLQASSGKTKAQRQAIIDRGIVAAKRRLNYNKNKAAALRNGTYFTTGIPETPGEPSQEPGSPVQPALPTTAIHESDDLPNAAQFSGKILNDSKTGKRFKSNGSKWVPL